MGDDPTLHATAITLLDAAEQLTDSTRLSTLTVDAIVDRAGTGKGTFYRHFPNQEGFLIALHRRFIHRLQAAALADAADREPGARRLAQITTAYLDACLGQAGLKAMLTEARAIPGVADSVDAALDEFATELQRDYRSMGLPHPGAASRLMVAMAHEVAMAEQRLGKPDRTLRSTLLTLGAATNPPPRGDGKPRQ